MLSSISKKFKQIDYENLPDNVLVVGERVVIYPPDNPNEDLLLEFLRTLDSFHDRLIANDIIRHGWNYIIMCSSWCTTEKHCENILLEYDKFLEKNKNKFLNKKKNKNFEKAGNSKKRTTKQKKQNTKSRSSSGKSRSSSEKNNRSK